METFFEIFGKPEATFGEIVEKYNSIPNSPRKKKLGRIISDLKKRYVERGKYVGIINILRYLGDYEKDGLLLELLKQHPDLSLFVLAFANSDMHSYSLAYKMEILGYDNDEEALKDDIELTLDTVLCKFLSNHRTKEDFNYVQELTDGATWLESNRRSMRGLL